MFNLGEVGEFKITRQTFLNDSLVSLRHVSDQKDMISALCFINIMILKSQLQKNNQNAVKRIWLLSVKVLLAYLMQIKQKVNVSMGLYGLFLYYLKYFKW